MTGVLDDLDSRPGSATSLLRTIVGAVFREQGGWLPTSVIVECLATVGVPDNRARTALTRVKSRGLLVAEQRGSRAGYRLADGAGALLERGDRRIHHPRVMDDDDPRWCLISYSIPETQRDARHQLRKRLSWIGAGTVTPALWITPDFLREEVIDVVRELGLDSRVTLFSGGDVHSGVAPLRELVAQWWDLAAIRDLHDDFLRRIDATGELHAPVPAAADGRDAFATWIRALDAWRPIPYLDPGLAASLLPADWPGHRSAALFLDIRRSTRSAAESYVDRLLAPRMRELH